MQFVGHLLWFDKVIYTNGFEWRFYRNTWKVSEEEINEKQNLSYEKYCKEPPNIAEEKVINEYLKDFNISELQFESFVLYKKVNGVRKWDNKEWKRLKEYLNRYNF